MIINYNNDGFIQNGITSKLNDELNRDTITCSRNDKYMFFKVYQ